ncbi:hypothetical protein OXX79_005481 [Metschnikowia pulcherrima]
MRIYVLTLVLTIFLTACATPLRLSGGSEGSGRRRKAISPNTYRKYGTNIPGSSVRVIKAKDGTYQVDGQTASQILTWLVSCMKSYIDETSFDAKGFSGNITSFRRTLRHLDFLADSSVRQDFDATDQFAFAKRMFDTMRRATHTLDIYESLDVPGSKLLCKFIKLGVQALALYNTLGGADIHVPNFNERVRQLALRISFCDRQFRDLAGVSIEMHLAFEKYLKEAESAITFLGTKFLNAS